MTNGNLVIKFYFFSLAISLLLILSAFSEEIQVSPLLKLDEILPSYEEVIDDETDFIIDKKNETDMIQESEEKKIVVISILNKITADVSQAKLELKEHFLHDDLKIYPIFCKINEPNERPEVSAYINIYDRKNNKKLFAGWMLKSLPSISSLEHPLYDIWINDCL